jgi:hypothetical protein
MNEWRIFNISNGATQLENISTGLIAVDGNLLRLE